MSNTLILKSGDIVASGGGWSKGAGASGMNFDDTAQLSYRFESFVGVSRIIRLTIMGTLLLSGNGIINALLTIPPSALPSWAHAAPGYTAGGTSVALTSDGVLMNAGLRGLPNGGLVFSISNTLTGSIVPSPTPLTWVFNYVAK